MARYGIHKISSKLQLLNISVTHGYPATEDFVYKWMICTRFFFGTFHITDVLCCIFKHVYKALNMINTLHKYPYIGQRNIKISSLNPALTLFDNPAYSNYFLSSPETSNNQESSLYSYISQK